MNLCSRWCFNFTVYVSDLEIETVIGAAVGAEVGTGVDAVGLAAGAGTASGTEILAAVVVAAEAEVVVGVNLVAI